MFARTRRLLLRPAFPEDAPVLARTIADERIVRNLASVPWPYDVADARAHIERMSRQTALPVCLVTRCTEGGPNELVGAIGLHADEAGEVELGYWIARAHWGQGYATEAGHAILDMARMLRLRRVHAGHFVDNPGSGRVLAKLGFRATGVIAPRYSCARGREVDTHLLELDLADGADVPIAA